MVHDTRRNEGMRTSQSLHRSFFTVLVAKTERALVVYYLSFCRLPDQEEAINKQQEHW